MLDNGNVDYDMTAEYIFEQYKLLAGGFANSFNTCVEKISYLPESPEIVVGASKLILTGLIDGAKTMAVTNLLVTMFKVMRQETAMHLVNREFQNHSDVVYRQYLIDACRIAYPIIMA